MKSEIQKLVSPGNWLQLTDDTLINLSKVEAIFMQEASLQREHRFVVTISMRDNAEPFVACTGTREKCKEYMLLLRDFVGGKKIIVYDSHRCECECGCMNQVIDGFRYCESCDEGDHIHAI